MRCATNSFYGHDAILASYCDVRPADIAGRIQHGWSVGLAGLLFDDFQGPFWTWTDTIAEAIRRENRPAVAIGAPYLYLPDAAFSGDVASASSELIIPHHSIRDRRLGQDQWDRFFAWLDTLSTKPDVLLHPTDYYGTNIVELLAKRGHLSLCASPGTLGDGQVKGDEADFLIRLRTILRLHRTVISDRICTALFYALHEGLDVKIDGSALTTTPPGDYDSVTGNPAWISKNFPGIWRGTAVARLEAIDELGLTWKRTPGELRKLLCK